jgi:hypothetical protein
VAELADAHGSGPCTRKGVGVRVPSSAPLFESSNNFLTRISRSAEYEQIFELERKLGSRPEYAAVSRYIHCLARKVHSVVEESA